MDEELDYLWETLGLEITAIPWQIDTKFIPRYAPPSQSCRQRIAAPHF